jgi:hypothetical protein
VSFSGYPVWPVIKQQAFSERKTQDAVIEAARCGSGHSSELTIGCEVVGIQLTVARRGDYILVVVVKIAQAVIHAAGEFLTNSEAIDSLMLAKRLGKEEIVLNTTVINKSPDKADVVATYYW